MSCPACDRRQMMHTIQMEGRQAALDGKSRSNNPYDDKTEHEYWEYGWIEENFMADIEEHRAVMEWTGSHLYYLTQQLDELLEDGRISRDVHDMIIDQIGTACRKLAEKLNGK